MLLERVNEHEAVFPSRRIGRRTVGPVGLGTASWALHDQPLDTRGATAVLAAAVCEGVNLIDTAFVYTTRMDVSYSERLVGAAVREIGAADSVLVATKGGHYRDGDRFAYDGRPETIRRQCELSLVALGLERIDLYQLHRPDPEVPIAETMSAFVALRDEGKIDLVGLSNVTVDQLEQARTVVEVASVQNYHEPGVRDGVLDRCDELGIAYLAYAPLGRSVFANRLGTVDALAATADARGVSKQQVVLAWHLSASPNLVAVVGARQAETIRDSARTASLVLSVAELRSLGG